MKVKCRPKAFSPVMPCYTKQCLFTEISKACHCCKGENSPSLFCANLQRIWFVSNLRLWLSRSISIGLGEHISLYLIYSPLGLFNQESITVVTGLLRTKHCFYLQYGNEKSILFDNGLEIIDVFIG
jgi:hypothetical protein